MPEHPSVQDGIDKDTNMQGRCVKVGWGFKAALATGVGTFAILLLVMPGGPWGSEGMAAVSAGMLNAFANWIGTHPILAAASFIALTAVARMAPLPTGAMMTIMGGYLFGTVVGAALAATGAVAAAALVPLAGRGVLVDVVRRQLGPQFPAVEREVTTGAFHYLLALRLLPVIPGWLVNLLPLAFPMPRRTVVVATFLGLLPISMIFASFGAGLAAIGQAPDLLSADAVLQWHLVLPLAALATLALLPVIRRRLVAKPSRK